MPSVTFNASTTWTAPPDIAGPPAVYLWGESGTGGTAAHGSHSGGGPGGGAFAGTTSYAGVTAGTVLTLTIPLGGTGAVTQVTGGTGTLTAAPGTSASGQTQGTGGAAGAAPIAFKGGDGAPGVNGATQNGSGGGGSGGSTGAGGNASGSTGGTAGSGAAGLTGAAGANGAGSNADGAAGTAPGGGASGGGSAGVLNHVGGAAAPGQVTIVWTTISYGATGYASVTARAGTAKKASSGARGYISLTGAPLPVRAVNQWSATFAQPASFGTTPPALQSAVVALTPGNSVGGGSGIPTAGNWLVCITGMTEQSAASGFTAGAADDIHSFWRPGNVAASQWAVSTAAAKTRTSAWYTANLARTAGDVYAAPNGAMAGMACLVIEVAGIGPWDVVTGIATGYAAAATSLNLALSAPSAPSCVIAAFCGDSTAATQAFAPGNPWQVLSTVSATNGSDHTSDAVLTSALLGTTTSPVSVTATAGSATDLSGVLLAVQVNAPSPIPAGANPAWPGRVILEAAFGSGYETPADQMTWTTLNDNAAPRTLSNQRFWSWRDSGGAPYALGQLQSSEGEVQLDNSDGALCPSTATSGTSSPYYPNVTTGTPIRLRCAVGTVTGQDAPPVTVNRWYVIQKNTLAWPEKRNKIFRDFTEVTLSDVWSVLSGAPPTPYRGEVEQDSPGWWWPCDDQALTGGVLPVSLRNAAKGSSTPLRIIASPGGVGAQDAYAPDGTDLTALAGTFASPPPPGIAVYSVAQDQGWLYGDPQSGQQSAQSGNTVTAQPGSAAWQQAGLLGNTGSAGWFLAANDTFPSLATGITVEGWWNYAYYAGAAAFQGTQPYNVLQQPYAPQSLLALHTSSAPIAILQLDRATGHLNLITYNGGTPTSHSVYTGSDLRCDAWIKVTVALTASTWAVKVNAGLTASASGSATISPTAPTWLIANGDLDTSGGSNLNAIKHGGNVKISHLAVYPGILPAWRENARYCAGITGFGLLPAPQGTAAQAVQNAHPTGFTPDGSEFGGNYGISGGGVVSYSLSAVAVAVAGSITSGPSQRAVIAGAGTVASPSFGAAAWTSWTAVAPLVQVYTSAAAVTETEAAACLSSGDSFVSGYGSGASGGGVGQVSAGTGASPPASATAAGDTVAQRWERLLGYAGVTASRAIDSSASLPVQAALDTGGQAAGSSLQNLTDSDNGLPGVDNCNTLFYRSRPHLAADTVVWYIGMDVISGMVPFLEDISWSSDPQQVWDDITIAQYSPDGATLPVITPSNATAVAAAQRQFGPRPKPVTSYLQDAGKIQAAADWWFQTFGALRRRAQVVSIDAAQHPSAWPLILGLNDGDLAQIHDAPFNGVATTGVYRVSHHDRSIAYGANGSRIEGRITLVLDPPPPGGYWS